MKSIILSFIVCSTAIHSFAQDESTPTWSVSPSLTYVRHFQGEKPSKGVQASRGLFYEGFEANGFSVRARIFNDGYENLALTISGGVNWFARPWILYNSPSSRGVSDVLGDEFILFPLGIGMQVLFPHKSRDSFMVYGGVEGTLNFISGEIGIDRQVQAGYTVLAGFTVKVFEFGVRYSAFSDIKNLGAHVGLRFKSFEL